MSGQAGEGEKKACTVTQAMNAAKRGLEAIRLTVIGEVSEFNDKPGYKAAYFTVRDDGCAMPCIMWRDRYNASGVQLRPGMLVQLTGNFSCYPAKGRMQFSVSRLEMAGQGNLRMQVAQIARRLEAEGLMDASRKRRLTALPQRIAVVTSPRGKAVHDVLRTLRRRYPLGQVLVCGVPVEGVDAPRFLREGLQAAVQADPAPDVILLVRGGGSYEDLMPFNDEALARAVAACPIPVVTGIGHEPDNSICDMVADVRCSTPTAAAESVSLSMEELEGKLGNATRSLASALVGRVGAAHHRLMRLADRPLWHDAHFVTGSYAQGLDALSERLVRAIPDAVAADRHALELHGQALRAVGTGIARQQAEELARARDALPRLGAGLVQRQEDELTRVRSAFPHLGAAVLAEPAAGLARAGERLRQAGPGIVREKGRQVALSAAKLDALSPIKTLSRGYSIAYGADGRSVIDSVEKAQAGDHIIVQVQDGKLEAEVSAVERQE